MTLPRHERPDLPYRSLESVGFVDDSATMGSFILTGSQQPALAAQVSQSLAGRMGRVELLPLCGAELLNANRLSTNLETMLWTGGFPAIFDRDIAPTDWLVNYTATYVERDVRQLLSVRDQDVFVTFTRAVAARSAQLLNYAAVGSDVGVSIHSGRFNRDYLRRVEPMSITRGICASTAAAARCRSKVARGRPRSLASRR